MSVQIYPFSFKYTKKNREKINYLKYLITIFNNLDNKTKTCVKYTPRMEINPLLKQILGADIKSLEDKWFNKFRQFTYIERRKLGLKCKQNRMFCPRYTSYSL